MLVARLELGKFHGRLCFDGRYVFLEDAAEEIRTLVEPYLNRELECKTSTWVNGEKVREVRRVAPGTRDHFSVLVWHYLPHRARVLVSTVKNEGEGEADVIAVREQDD
jgi:hypothetical protein